MTLLRFKRELPGTTVPVLSEGTILYVDDANAQAYIVEFVDETARRSKYATLSATSTWN
jgi:hypothetical protein